MTHITKLNREKQTELLEQLSNSLSATQEAAALTAAQREALDRRLTN